MAFRALRPLGTRKDAVFGAVARRLACSQCLRIAAPDAGRRTQGSLPSGGLLLLGRELPLRDDKPNFMSLSPWTLMARLTAALEAWYRLAQVNAPF